MIFLKEKFIVRYVKCNPYIFAGWNEAYPDVALFNPSPLLNKLVSEGKMGMKAGEGFYKYEKK